MCQRHLLFRLSVIAFSVGVGVAVPALGQEDSIAWRADHETATAEARTSRTPMFVDLWATWCAPCKVMDKEVYPDARVVKASKAVVMVKVDVDKHPEIAEKYAPDGIPTVVFLDPFGNEIVRHEGMVDAQRLATMLGQLPASYADAPGVFDTLSSHADDHATLMAVADYYVSKRAYPAALVYFERASGTALARRDPKARGDAALGIGTTLLNLAAAPAAETVLREALEKSDRSREPMLRYELGSALLAQGRTSEARKLFAQVVKRFPETEAARRAADGLK